MGDVIKITKDKRHRSSSSLAGATIEGTRSERKLEINASIPEVDDHFAVAEARCNDLQENIDLIKSLKRKKKLRKRSMTKVMEQPKTPDNVPFITVRTQPKKKVSSQAARLRRLEVPQNPTRGYLDPATVEQHRMIGQVRGYNNAFKQPHQERNDVAKPHGQPVHAEHGKLHLKMKPVRHQRTHAEGDTDVGPRLQISTDAGVEAAYGRDDISNYSSYAESDRPLEIHQDSQHHIKASGRRKHISRDVPLKEDNREGDVDYLWKKPTATTPMAHWRPTQAPVNRIHQSSSGSQAEERPFEELYNKGHMASATQRQNAEPPPALRKSKRGNQAEERPVVELFNKSHMVPTMQRQNTEPAPASRKLKKARPSSRLEEIANSRIGNLINVEQRHPKKDTYHPRRIKYRSRRYEMPTVASQMKQAGMRYYYGSSNYTNIPFVVSKSTAPSHNIGVNIQQVLNGLKIQQPLSGIPLTIAHHMGLGHVPTYSTKSAGVVPALDQRQINVIKVGQRLLRLPSYKYMSYNRLLSLYREGDGMVPRFLKAISRPHYFYTSMYNLATNNEDIDGATSKGRSASQEAKQNFAEFANLYREYENINKCIKEGQCEPALEHRKEELSREIAAREQYLRRQVVQDYRTSAETEPTLRASASQAEDNYRHSTFIPGGDAHH